MILSVALFYQSKAVKSLVTKFAFSTWRAEVWDPDYSCVVKKQHSQRTTKKKEQYRQCDDKNFSRFRASVWQDSRSKMKTSNTTTHNCDTGLLGSEYRVVNSPLTLLVF